MTNNSVPDAQKRHHRITMADLARLAGVSTITVSRALADSPRVHESTKRRVQELARRHGYALNVSARNLRLRSSHTIAVVVEMTPSSERPMSGAYPLDLLGGITQELTASGYSVLLSAGGGPGDGPPQGAEGVILLGQGAKGTAVSTADWWNLPLAIWGAVTANDPHVVVGSDNRGGGRLVARRFRQLGRLRPCFVGDLAYKENEQRYLGFQSGFESVGVQPLLINQVEFTTRAGVEAMRELLRMERAARPDAVFACNDLIAVGVMQALREAGVDVPGEIAVAGYDDTPLAAGVLPALTTVHQDMYQGGILLARKILAMIAGEAVGSELLPVHLVVRST